MTEENKGTLLIEDGKGVTEAVEVAPGKHVVIFDLDKTLCDTRHRDHLMPPKGTTNSSAYDATTELCWKDSPIWDTIVVLMMLATMNHIIVLKTGRTEKFRLMTINWLTYLGVHFNGLIMLPDDFDGDYGQWKADMLNHELIGGAERVLCVFDDHPDAVAAYTKAGVTCYMVPPYNGPAHDSPLLGKGLYDEVEFEPVDDEGEGWV